jgi:ATP-dependent exoDNAse (exonuclease V) beta subunit
MRTFSCVGEDGEYTRSCWGEVQKRLPLSHSPLPESEIQEYAQNEQVNSLKKNSIPNIATDLWHPMDWLPRLRIFHSALEDWTFTAKRRGTLIHHCLEYLQISGTNQESIKAAALRAAEIGIDSFPLPVPHKNTMQYEIADILTWYASQPDTPHWLAYGTAEQSLMDADGRQSRVDLLVDDNHELVAVEYKTGTAGELPASEHKNQLLRYLNLLSQASPLHVRGVLVYLDRRELFFIAPEEYA